jgi:hypothetical protein
MPSTTTRLAASFRAARWAASGGQPACPKCYDGQDVRPGYPCTEARRELGRYFCACCKYAFGDATGTPLAHTSRPLLLWAYVALGGTWEELGLAGAANKWKRDDLRDMRRRLAGSETSARWAAALRAAGFTPARLARAISRRD